ncbi:MAG: hypothetical protein ACREQE_02465 [Candidatus Binataceae bacterium]
MSKSLIHISDAAPAPGQRRTITARRIRFVAEAPPGAKVLRSYSRPRPCVALEEELDLAELPPSDLWPEPFDQIVVVMVPSNALEGKIDENWMSTPGHPQAAVTASSTCNAHKIQWRSGRALIQGPVEGFAPILLALVDFAFYEGELRALEQALDKYEEQAETDVARAHRIRIRDRGHWRRFAETIEELYRMRLSHARLESQVAAAERALPPAGREVMTRLNDESRLAARLEAFSDHLEAFEDLYEGANDRVTEHRWYLASQWLELGIVLILIIEVVLLAVGPYLWHLK